MIPIILWELNVSSFFGFAGARSLFLEIGFKFITTGRRPALARRPPQGP
jgi:hypothetical protein